MLTSAGTKLLDFGLAKAIRGGSAGGRFDNLAGSFRQRHYRGTHGYRHVSIYEPQQLECREVDARSDIFSLGAVLYEMTTGRPAFSGKSQVSIASAILDKDPEPVSVIQPLTPPGLDHLIAVCLAKNADERWQSATDVAHELRWIGSTSQQATPPAQKQRYRALPWVLAATAILCESRSELHDRWFRSEPAARVLRASINPVYNYRFQFTGDYGGPPVIRPRNSRVVFAMDGAGGQALWIRLEALNSVPTSGN